MSLNFDINDIDFNDIGGWPLPLKVVAIVAVSIGVLIGGYYYDISGQIENLEAAQKKEKELKEVFRTKQNRAVNLQAYKDQMVEMERSFGAMLRRLPSKTEVAELLVDISQTGLANGLEFELFKPSNEVPAEFYAELPIQIRVTGQYHQFGQFVSDVAKLPRIVTIHDISIKPLGKKEGSRGLMMEATAKTYRYVEDSAE